MASTRAASSGFTRHVHGASKMQVSGGMAGLISVGSISDYACIKPSADGMRCEHGLEEDDHVAFRHMLLKDAQLVDLDEARKTARMQFDEDPGFCDGSNQEDREGSCTHKDDAGKVNGRWMFSINGAVYPGWKVGPGKAEVWRIQNASANITYDMTPRRAGLAGRPAVPRSSPSTGSASGAGSMDGRRGAGLWRCARPCSGTWS